MAILHGADDGSILEDEISASRQASGLKQLSFTDIAVERNVFKRKLDQGSKGETQSSRVRAGRREEEDILAELPFLGQKLEMLECDRIIKVEKETIRWKTFRQLGLKDGDRDVGSQCKGA